MKHSKSILSAIFAAISLSQTAHAEEILLVCDGKISSSLPLANKDEVKSFTLEKVDGKVVSVRTDKLKFTLDKIDISTPSHKGPVYVQLLVDAEKLILRTEVTESNKTADTVLFNSGAYTEQRMFASSSGRCTVTKRVF